MNPRLGILAAVAAAADIMPEGPKAVGEPNYLGHAEPVDGPAAQCGRNAHCPCGSGKKHKRCCRKPHKGTWPAPAEPEEALTESSKPTTMKTGGLPPARD